jgi:predicted glycosyltransferase
VCFERARCWTRAHRKSAIRVWIDLSNSPHVPLFEPVIERLRADGHDVLLTARDHAQTLAPARLLWPDLHVVGGQSPGGRASKAVAMAVRAEALRRLARHYRPDVALSHGSYAQVTAARAARIPAVTMMDYEYQPANHLSFRLAKRVLVPRIFPDEALRRFGASDRKTSRYDGFKEELYLAGFQPNPAVLENLSLDPARVIAVFRPPPEGALYQRSPNRRFEDVLARVLDDRTAQIIVLPRQRVQAERYVGPGVIIPHKTIDGRSLLAYADLLVGAGGTMNRESALLGTPTYTVFAPRLAAVDAELIRRGLLRDLRDPNTNAVIQKKPFSAPCIAAERSRTILRAILKALVAATEA